MEPTICRWHQHRSAGLGFTIFTIANAGYPLHTHEGFHELVVALRGSFRQRVNGQAVEHREREMVLIREHDTHELFGGGEVVNIPFALDWLPRAAALLDGPSPFEPFINAQSPPVTRIPVGRWPMFAEDLDTMLDYVYDIRGQMTFLMFLLQAFTCFSLPESTPACDGPAWMEHLLAELDRTPANEHTVADLAATAGCSPEHLARSFRKHLGKTPSTYLNERRMLRAARLLSHTTSRISEIAYRTGFEDAGYFGRLFRVQFGMSPGEYRRNHTTVPQIG